MKTFNLTIDLKNRNYQTFTVKQADDLNELNITLTQDSLPYLLTNYNVEMWCRKSDGTVTEQSSTDTTVNKVTIVDAVQGKIKLTLLKESTTAVGIVYAEIVLLNSNGERVTSATFDFSVIERVSSDDVIKSTSYISELEEIKATFTQLNADYINATQYNALSEVMGIITFTQNGTSFTFDVATFNPLIDVLDLYYQGCKLMKGKNYSISGRTITFGWTLVSGEEIDYEILKGIKG